MNIIYSKTDFQIGEKVILKCDPELNVIIVMISIDKSQDGSYHVEYKVKWIVDGHYHESWCKHSEIKKIS